MKEREREREREKVGGGGGGGGGGLEGGLELVEIVWYYLGGGGDTKQRQGRCMGTQCTKTKKSERV